MERRQERVDRYRREASDLRVKAEGFFHPTMRQRLLDNRPSIRGPGGEPRDAAAGRRRCYTQVDLLAGPVRVAGEKIAEQAPQTSPCTGWPLAAMAWNGNFPVAPPAGVGIPALHPNVGLAKSGDEAAKALGVLHMVRPQWHRYGEWNSMRLGSKP